MPPHEDLLKYFNIGGNENNGGKNYSYDETQTDSEDDNDSDDNDSNDNDSDVDNKTSKSFYILLPTYKDMVGQLDFFESILDSYRPNNSSTLSLNLKSELD